MEGTWTAEMRVNDDVVLKSAPCTTYTFDPKANAIVLDFVVPDEERRQCPLPARTVGVMIRFNGVDTISAAFSSEDLESTGGEIPRRARVSIRNFPGHMDLYNVPDEGIGRLRLTANHENMLDVCKRSEKRRESEIFLQQPDGATAE